MWPPSLTKVVPDAARMVSYHHQHQFFPWLRRSRSSAPCKGHNANMGCGMNWEIASGSNSRCPVLKGFAFEVKLEKPLVHWEDLYLKKVFWRFLKYICSSFVDQIRIKTLENCWFPMCCILHLLIRLGIRNRVFFLNSLATGKSTLASRTHPGKQQSGCKAIGPLPALFLFKGLNGYSGIMWDVIWYTVWDITWYNYNMVYQMGITINYIRTTISGDT